MSFLFTLSAKLSVKPTCFPVLLQLDLLWKDCDKVLYPTQRSERVKRPPRVTIWVINSNQVSCAISPAHTGNYRVGGEYSNVNQPSAEAAF